MPRTLAIMTVLALAGCSQPTTWECRTTSGDTVTLDTETRLSPTRRGGVDQNGWDWKADAIASCREVARS